MSDIDSQILDCMRTILSPVKSAEINEDGIIIFTETSEPIKVKDKEGNMKSIMLPRQTIPADVVNQVIVVKFEISAFYIFKYSRARFSIRYSSITDRKFF